MYFRRSICIIYIIPAPPCFLSFIWARNSNQFDGKTLVSTLALDVPQQNHSIHHNIHINVVTYPHHIPHMLPMIASYFIYFPHHFPLWNSIASSPCDASQGLIAAFASRCGELQGPGRRIARLPAQQWCRFAAVQSRSPMGLTGGFNGIEIRWGFDGDLMGSSGIFSTMNSGYGRGNGNGGLTPNICWLLQ